jgi:hypothetical protein
VAELGRVRPLLILKERAPGDDNIRAAFLVLDDAELPVLKNVKESL